MFSSCSSWRGKVPDIGVKMGEEITIPEPWTLFFLGDLRKLRSDELRDSFLVSCARLRLEGLFLSLLVLPGVGGMVLTDLVDGEVSIGGGSYALPSALALSCSITCLYISSS